MQNYLIETLSNNPWYNLALERYLTEHVQYGNIILYLWQNDNTVVIGKNQNALKECQVKLLEDDGGYLARRTTGGGAVYQDMGNLCFTFITSPECYDLHRQLRVIQKACDRFGIVTKLSGRNDIITEEGYKFSGNAFSMSSKCKVHHGTLMLHVDVERMKRYLTPSKEKMKSKGIASVESRVCNLKELNPQITIKELKNAIKKVFEQEYGLYTELSEAELEAKKLKNYYMQHASWEWRLGKSPESESTYLKRFTWGEVEAWIKLKGLYVAECKIYTDALDVELAELIEKELLNKRYDRLYDADISYMSEMQRKQVSEVLEWLSDVWEKI